MKVAIIGLGQVGSKYDRDYTTAYSHRNSILRNIENSEKFYIDLDFEYVKSIAKIDNAIFSKNIESLPDFLDLAIISVPTKYHLKCFINLINTVEVKKIILEKPVGSNYEECKTFYEISLQSGINIYVNYMRNLLPETQEIYNYIRQNNLRIFDIEVSITGTLINNGSHFLALIAYLVDIPLKKFKIHKRDSETITFKYKANNIFVKTIKEAKYPYFSMRMFHDSGLIEYDEQRSLWTIYKYKVSSTYSKFNRLEEFYKFNLNLSNAQDYFLNYVINNSDSGQKKIDLKTAMIIQKLFGE